MAGNNPGSQWPEFKRKLFHILLGILIVMLVQLDILKLWMVILLISIYIDIPIISWFLKHFERPKHIKTFPGKGVLFIIAALLVLMIFFPKNIISASIMIWTFGDSISWLIGRNFGKIRHPLNDARLVEGTIAGIIISTIAASMFVNILFALIASIAALGIESLEIKFFRGSIDDNLLVPLISAIVLFLL